MANLAPSSYFVTPDWQPPRGVVANEAGDAANPEQLAQGPPVDGQEGAAGDAQADALAHKKHAARVVLVVLLQLASTIGLICSFQFAPPFKAFLSRQDGSSYKGSLAATLGARCLVFVILIVITMVTFAAVLGRIRLPDKNVAVKTVFLPAITLLLATSAATLSGAVSIHVALVSMGAALGEMLAYALLVHVERQDRTTVNANSWKAVCAAYLVWMAADVVAAWALARGWSGIQLIVVFLCVNLGQGIAAFLFCFEYQLIFRGKFIRLHRLRPAQWVHCCLLLFTRFLSFHLTWMHFFSLLWG